MIATIGTGMRGMVAQSRRAESAASRARCPRGQYLATKRAKGLNSAHLGRDAPVTVVAVAVAVEYALRSSLLSFLADFALG